MVCEAFLSCDLMFVVVASGKKRPTSATSWDSGKYSCWQNLLFCFVLCLSRLWSLRDWSLITGREGATKREGGGYVKFYPYEKGGGAEKVLTMLKGGGGTQNFGVVFRREPEVLVILKGGRKKFQLFKSGGGAKSFTLS